MAKFVNQDGLLYFWQQIKGKLAGKVDVETGKGLSTNDYTTAEKDKLAGIQAGANKTTVENVLTSTSAANALSAAQGKVLKDQLDEMQGSLGELGYGDMLKATYDADNDGKVDAALHADTADKATTATNADNASDATMLGGQLPTYYAAKTVVDGKLDKTGDGSNVTVAFTQATTRANVATGEKLTAIVGKIAKYFADLKTVAFTGKYSDLTGLPTIPTVTNDLTDALKANYDAAYTHSQTAHAPANAQANVIEGVQVNGKAITLTSKVANISVPTTVAQLSDAANYALKSDLTNVYKYKGSVATVANLPATGNTAGDVYNVEERGINYAWNGTEWDALGELFEIEAVTNAEIDTIMAS